MNAPFRPSTAFTDVEFERLTRSGGFGDTRAELRRGMIVKHMSPQYVPHGRVKRLLAKALETSVSAAGLPWLVDQEISVALGSDFQPLPDIIVWDPGAAAKTLSGPIPAHTVRLIVEVSDSTLTDDLGPKRDEYAEAGTAEYWVADVQGGKLTLHARTAGGAFGALAIVPFGAKVRWLSQPSLETETALLV